MAVSYLLILRDNELLSNLAALDKLDNKYACRCTSCFFGGEGDIRGGFSKELVQLINK